MENHMSLSKTKSSLLEADADTKDLSKPIKHAFTKSLCFSVIFTLIPWPELWQWSNGSPMRDRSVYLRQIDTFDLTIDRMDYSSFLDLISYEILWSWLLRSLSDLGVSGELILDGVAFIFIFFASYLITLELPWVFLLLLVNPMVISLAFSQSRIALMVAIMFFALIISSKSRIVAAFSVGTTVFIHTSAPLFLLLYLVSTAGIRKNSQNRSPILPIIAGAIVSLLAGPLMSTILAALQDRRAENYADMSSGIVYLSIWILCTIYLLNIWPTIRNDKYSNIALAVFTLATTSLVFDSYASRFLATLFPILIIAIFREYPKTKKIPFISLLLIGYIGMLWLYFLK